MSDGKGSAAQNPAGVNSSAFPGAIIAGLDVHSGQITFDCLDCRTGEVLRGRIASEPAAVREWMAAFPGREVHVAVEACTGWLFVAQAVGACGGTAHLAETVETRALRGRKRRAKTDRQDALWLRALLAQGRLPESWIAPEHVRQWRSRRSGRPIAYRRSRSVPPVRNGRPRGWYPRAPTTPFDTEGRPPSHLASPPEPRAVHASFLAQ